MNDRGNDGEWWLGASISIASKEEEISTLVDDFAGILHDNGVSEKEIFGIRTALVEAVTNAAKHGNQYDPAKKVSVAYTVTPDGCTIIIRDEGPGFDPDGLPDPTEVENLERLCGRGVMLMRHYMSEVCFKRGGSEVVMRKDFSAPSAPEPALTS